MSLKTIKLDLLSFFRGIFIYHHYSLEFRAKLFAAMIAANPNTNQNSYNLVKKIGMQIYANDEKRAEILVRTTKEYVNKINIDNGLNLDELIIDIDKSIKGNKRYVKKINISHLRYLQEYDNEEVVLLQERIIEFAQSEILEYK